MGRGMTKRSASPNVRAASGAAERGVEEERAAEEKKDVAKPKMASWPIVAFVVVVLALYFSPSRCPPLQPAFAVRAGSPGRCW